MRMMFLRMVVIFTGELEVVLVGRLPFSLVARLDATILSKDDFLGRPRPRFCWIGSLALVMVSSIRWSFFGSSFGRSTEDGVFRGLPLGRRSGTGLSGSWFGRLSTPVCP